MEQMKLSEKYIEIVREMVASGTKILTEKSLTEKIIEKGVNVNKFTVRRVLQDLMEKGAFK